MPAPRRWPSCSVKRNWPEMGMVRPGPAAEVESLRLENQAAKDAAAGVDFAGVEVGVVLRGGLGWGLGGGGGGD
jgi:hypothetical protein